MPSLHRILFYEYVPDIAERRATFREAHLAHIREEQAAGRIVMAGAVGDPPHSGVIVFGDVDPAVIEEWVRTDPYMTAGLVTASRIEPWNVV